MLLARAVRSAQAACRRDAPPVVLRRDAPPVVLRRLLSLAATDAPTRIAPAHAAAVLPTRRHFHQPGRLESASLCASVRGAHGAAARRAAYAGCPPAGCVDPELSAAKRRLLHARAQPAANSSAAPSAAASSPVVLGKGDAARATNVSKDGFTAVTTLANGLRVATENTPGHFAALGIYIDAGSRYETEKTRGCSHLMDRLAFKGTVNRTIKDIQDEAQSLGGNITCTSSRETIIYQAAVFKDDVPQAFSLLADVVRNLKVTERDVDEQRETALYEITDLAQKPESLLPEYLHLAAYNNNTLGLQLLCDPERLAAVQLDDILFYRETFYRPSRIVVAACGVDHAQVVELAEKELGDWRDPEYPLAPESSSERVAAVVASTPDRTHLGEEAREAFAELVARSAPRKENDPMPTNRLPDYVARYTGGSLLLPREVPAETSSASEGSSSAHENFSHLHVAFPGLPLSDPDVYTLATIQTLLGGGGSFSAGGPGKGMYSRLFTQVLNQHGWVESCAAFNHTYSDSGLFGISASCLPQYIECLPSVIAAELAALLCPEMDLPADLRAPPMHVPRDRITEADLSRARNQLRSGFLMNLEQRMIQLEDMARQVQLFGRKIPVREMCDYIDAVTLADVRRVAERVLVEGPMKVVASHESTSPSSASSGTADGKAWTGLWETFRKHSPDRRPGEKSERGAKITGSLPSAIKLEGGGMTVAAYGDNLDQLGDVVETFASFGIGYRKDYPSPLPDGARLLSR